MATKSYWQRFQRERISRRRLLGAAGVGAAGLAVAAACGGGDGGVDTAGTPVDEGEVTKDGILHLSFSEVLPTMSLFGSTALATNLTWGVSILDHLFYTPLDTGKPEPMLAYEWENPDELGLETIFKIHETFFHDKPPVNGRQVLASDVAASYKAYAADDIAMGLEWHHSIMEDAVAPDDLTVIIKQNKPYAWLFHPGGAGSLASSNIIPVETLDPDLFDMSKDLIGSGRTLLTESRLDSFFRGERHPGWRIEGEPYLAGWTSVFIGETAQAQATFRAGEIDTVGLSNKLEADDMEAELGERVIITSSISRAYHTLNLNLDRVPDFKNPKVRKAINRAIDRQALIQGVELDAEGGVPAGPLPPALLVWELPEDEMDEYFRHDPEEARQLLREAEFDFEKELTIIFPAGASGEMQKRAQLLKEQFTAVGLKVKIEDQDLLSVWLPQTLLNGNFDMTTYTQLAYDDPHFPLSHYTTHSPMGSADDPRGRNNLAFFDDELTAAIDDAEEIIDPEELVEKVKDVVRMIMEKQAPIINLYASRSYGARWHWYKGVWPSSRGAWAGIGNGRNWIDTRLRGS